MSDFLARKRVYTHGLHCARLRSRFGGEACLAGIAGKKTNRIFNNKNRTRDRCTARAINGVRRGREEKKRDGDDRGGRAREKIFRRAQPFVTGRQIVIRRDKPAEIRVSDNEK